MSKETIDLYVSVKAGTDADEEELDQLARELAKDLDELDSIESVEPVQAENLPDGAKGFPVILGTVLVKLAEVGGISALITVLGSWLSRDKSRSLELKLGNKKLAVTGLSQDEQKELIRWFKTQTNAESNSS